MLARIMASFSGKNEQHFMPRPQSEDDDEMDEAKEYIKEQVKFGYC